MIVIKLMSGENLTDSDVGKGYRMVVVGDGGNFNFGHDLKGNPIVEVTTHPYGHPDTATYFLEGNAYVLSDSGKTIGSFWGRKKPVYEDSVPGNNTDVDVASIIKATANQAFPEGKTLVTYSATPTATDVQLNKWASKGLTEAQLGLLQYGPTEIAKSPNQREKAQRARTSYLMSQGIPVDIAMEASMYLLEPVLKNNCSVMREAALKQGNCVGTP